MGEGFGVGEIEYFNSDSVPRVDTAGQSPTGNSPTFGTKRSVSDKLYMPEFCMTYTVFDGIILRSAEALGQDQHIRARGVGIAVAAKKAPSADEVQAREGDGVAGDEGVLPVAAVVIAQQCFLGGV